MNLRTIFALLAVLFTIAPTVAAAAKPRPVADLDTVVVSQPIAASAAGPAYGDSINVKWTTPFQAWADRPEVDINIYAALPLGVGERWYASPSTLVATLKPERYTNTGGTISIPLSAIHAPSSPLPGPAPDLAKKQWMPGDLPGHYVVEVLSMGHLIAYVALDIHASGEIVAANPAVPGFLLGAVHDSKGEIVAADRGAWRGRRLASGWMVDQTFPKASVGQASDPVETSDCAVDSHDNVYMQTVNGVYRFGPDGNPQAWTADADYINYPYPGEVRDLLGVRLDPSVAAKKDYVFGPGGGGAHKFWVAADAVKNPGFAYRWGGMAIDKQDNVYLAETDPVKEVEVFDNTGKWLRSFPLPDGNQAISMRFDNTGALWIVGGQIDRVDPTTGEPPAHSGRYREVVRMPTSKIAGDGRNIAIGLDGSMYVYDAGGIVRRYNPDGRPDPFSAPAPYVTDGGEALDLNAARTKATDKSGYVANLCSVIGNSDGSFDVIGADTGDPNSAKQRALHFTADGTFVPRRVFATFSPHETGNVFVGDEPARVDVQFVNVTQKPVQAAVLGDVSDIDGNPIGPHAFDFGQFVAVPSMACTAFTAADDRARALGYYNLELTAAMSTSGGSTIDSVVGSAHFFGGRVTARGDTFQRYSPFGSVRMEANPELIRRAGGGLNRNHNPVYWNDVEPKPGEWHLQPSDALDFYRAHAMGSMVILAYGEPWDGGGFPKCRITGYDDFFNYVATMIDHQKETVDFWQFWNEPNYFWHVPGPFQYEQYAIVLQGVYDIQKALDPNAECICDGFASSAQLMGDLGKLGASGSTDAVPIHYPGVSTVSFDQMPLTGTVESKVGMIGDLRRIRDDEFPGKPIFNTEEGLWGKADRTLMDGAALLPRMYVSQIAAGVDRLTWFECFSDTDPTYLLRGRDEGPWPAYFAYATASRFLENAQYVGEVGSGLTQVHVFADAGRPVIVAWSVSGKRPAVIDVGVPSVSVTDWQGNASTVSSPGGKLNLIAGATVQYITGASPSIFKPIVTPQLATGVQRSWFDKAKQPAAKASINDLFYGARKAELEMLLYQGIRDVDHPRGSVAQADSALVSTEKAMASIESDGRYLRGGHTVLDIVRRTAYFMHYAAAHGNAVYAAQLAIVVNRLCYYIEASSMKDPAWYPGVMIRVALDTSAIRNATPAGQPLDEQFAPQVTKHAGDPVEVEMTIYNWTNQTISGTLNPSLPDGWGRTLEWHQYTVAPMKFARITVTVTVPAGTLPGIYGIGAGTWYKGSGQHELHTMRVQVVGAG